MSITFKFLYRFFLGVIIILQLLIIDYSFAQVNVNGYYKKNGTYVQPHYRSSPNNTKLDNWSTKGNVNPYTGKEGTKNVYENENYLIRNYNRTNYESKVYSGVLNNNLSHKTNVNIHNADYKSIYNDYNELWGYRKLYYNADDYIGYWIYDKNYKYLGKQIVFKHSNNSYLFDSNDTRIIDDK